MAEAAVHVFISGRVQGVWFRGWTKQEAGARNLTGWVRNRRDGTVEAVFEGAAMDIDDMLARCHQGPPAAKVVEVRSEAIAPINFPDFRHRPTE